MLNLALSLSLLLSSAQAEGYNLRDNLPKGPLKARQYAVDPGAVSIDGVVQVPLYSHYASESRAALVAVSFPYVDSPILMALSVGRSGITLTQGTAEKAGAFLKDTSQGQVAVISEMRIGGLVLSNVKVQIGDQDSMGLTTFSGLATAVLPSEGVVRFAPAAQADGLLSAVGEPMAYSSAPVQQVKYMRSKYWVGGEAVIVSGTVNGQEGPIFLDAGSQIAKSYAGQTPIYTVGLSKYYATELVFGGVEVALLSSHWSNPPYMVEAQGARFPGSEMAAWNIAIDPSTKRIAISTQSRTQYSSSWDIELGQALAELETAKRVGEADLSDFHSGLASLYMGNNDAVNALEYAALVSDAKPESCASYHLLGRAQALAGNHTQAIDTLTQSGTLYQAWIDMGLEMRDELAMASLENPEMEKQVQSHSCFDAWGLAAHSALEIGDFEQVAELYVAHHDLDASLPQAAAAAYLAQERYPQANAALAQRRLLSNVETAEMALTRAVIQHAQGNPAALENYQRAAFLGGLVEARAWGTAAAELQGAPGTTALTVMAPFRPHIALAYAEALDATAVDSAQAWETALSAYEHALAARSGEPDVWAGYGRALRKTGSMDQAIAALYSGLEVDAEAPELLLLAGDLAADADDYARAEMLYAKAGAASPTTATYAGLLSL
ncbi:MAG: tetratricopeptide (TPR) repeat protein [Cognaticolwellia sp.]|jgi:tetratricopeptide (TPR) repeat protein